MKTPTRHIDITETAENFSKYPSMAKAMNVEATLDNISIDYGHYGSGGSIHKNLMEVETEEERRNNPF